ncbi:hypothetical protein HMN09_00224900 [Mycena chlorophos]|uniref:Cytochrome P450 n=1 Tax=Mycena chlorophos TaxID=658473 RepID=A0A8H6TLJ7_MYCCL|nr:hypothetical protein HMN09_00224900 [Mycena chlorophos]
MPYSIGLYQAACAFLSAGFAVQAVVAAMVLLAIVVALPFVASQDGTDVDSDEDEDTPPTLPGCLPWLLWDIAPFFRRRYDFLNRGFRLTRAAVWQFKLMNNTVIVLSGASARRAFFYAKGFDLTEGFKMLSGALPMVRGVTSDGLHTKRIATIHKRLAAVQRNAPLTDLIPQILDDARRMLETYEHAGSFDPFEAIYSASRFLIFQTTVRSLSSTELASSPERVARLKTLYDRLDASTTPASVLMPWLPTPALLRKLWATKEIYEMVVDAIQQRERDGEVKNDTLQMLLDSGDERLTVVGFVMGLLIAGARATGTTAAWIVLFLGGHTDWQARARAEIESLLPDTTSSSSLSDALAEIPVATWESSTPVLDAIIRETLRVAQPHTAMRRNLGPDTYIDGKRIPSGAFVLYPFSDVHLDPAIYPDPWRWDPARPHSTKDLGYVGWGVGKTTCLGTRLAKIELKLVLALFLLAFDFSVQQPLPVPNWNDMLLCRPATKCTVAYTKRTQRAL